MPLKHIAYSKQSQDGRRKLTAQQKNEIKTLYSQLQSYQKVASHFSPPISRQTVFYTIHPEAYQKSKALKKNKKSWLTNYQKERHTAYIRKFRDKKRSQGLLLKKNLQKATYQKRRKKSKQK